MTTLVPGYLAPASRYAGDDWAGSNALKFSVYTILPVLNSDGTVTAGTLMNLTGFSVLGTIWKRSEGSPLPAPTGAILGDPTLGTITLSLASQYTQGLPTQSYADWSNPDLSFLLVRPRIVDPAGNIITQGIQPLFVF